MADSARKGFERDLERRGYTVVIGGYDWASRGFPGDYLLHHRPCGVAVFNPDIHDDVCVMRED